VIRHSRRRRVWPVKNAPCATAVVRQYDEDRDLPRLVRFDYRLYPAVEQIADKVCAAMQLYDGKRSSREKDLVDLVVLAVTQDIDGAALAHELATALVDPALDVTASGSGCLQIYGGVRLVNSRSSVRIRVRAPLTPPNSARHRGCRTAVQAKYPSKARTIDSAIRSCPSAERSMARSPELCMLPDSSITTGTPARFSVPRSPRWLSPWRPM